MTASVTLTALLGVRGIRKSFAGVTVLKDVAFEVMPGEVHALVGENGAGKSTLLSIVNGLQPPDSGTIEVLGRPIVLGSPAAAKANRLAMVHQELMLCPNLTVADNVFMGAEPRTIFGRIDRATMERRTRALLARINVDLDPALEVAKLSLAERQIVEICRALALTPRVLVFDEPTASLAETQVQSLLTIIRRLRAEGIGIVYVSHRLREVFAIADRITVLRDGQIIDTLPVQQAEETKIISLMVGRDFNHEAHWPNQRVRGDVLLEADRIGAQGEFKDISLTLHAGEIVGIAGLMGCARESVMKALFGILPIDSGEIRVKGRPCRLSPGRAIGAGIGYMPADRKKHGLVLGMPVHDNLVLPILRRVSRAGFISWSRRKEVVNGLVRDLAIRLSSVATEVANLSGGNQQKVVIGKWLARGGDILLVEEPTRGVDVGAKPQIWSALRQLAGSGKAVLLVSSELPELMSICDRILVMSCGRITGSFARSAFSAEAIARCAVEVPAVRTTSAQYQ